MRNNTDTDMSKDFVREPLCVRASNPNAYRCGQWARVVGMGWLPRRFGENPRDPRAVMIVEFVDGVRDTWALDDPDAGYEYNGQVTA